MFAAHWAGAIVLEMRHDRRLLAGIEGREVVAQLPSNLPQGEAHVIVVSASQSPARAQSLSQWRDEWTASPQKHIDSGKAVAGRGQLGSKSIAPWCRE